MKRRDLEKKLRDLGWQRARHGARHDVWARGERELVVPRHVEINEYTAKAILRDAHGGY
ncbi:MAG: type II toxin-antitoxin system HicA family toxin [candidate division NC10 bacterium]|nr:type II toxin-antitoxin system HicA family toxin [candidate division NC10 bacterium]MDE2322013.1 type II toxin-antitoxin system HicA family toxin [candidate division NC10 bacterium]